MTTRFHAKKKLIEVALPLDAINKASVREKSIRHGHPSTLHLWWARRPLAAARAVIFAQMVDDPSAHPDIFPTGKAQEKERQRLFRIIEDLVRWENTTNETVLQQARDEIWQSWRATCAENADHPRAKELFDRHKLPAFHDPFAGGGSLPLEAQRLGLEAYASDLNPVAVLINKAMIEIPQRFSGHPPVNPEARKKKELISKPWRGAQGLAEDVRYYGQWMRDEAERQIGHLYPKAEITDEMAKERQDLKKYVGKKLTVIAWLWARTVKSPNPAFGQMEVPLASTFMLSTKVGKEAYVEPLIEDGGYRFTVKVGNPKDAKAAKNGTKLSRGSFRCLFSGVPISYKYIDDEANADRMGARMMAIIAKGDHDRVFLTPTGAMEAIARKVKPTWKPDTPSRGTWASNAQGRRYGFRTFGDYFTPRQLVALTTFSDLVRKVRERVKQDALTAGLNNNVKSLASGGAGAAAYADAVAVYLGFLVNQVANHCSSVCGWNSANMQMRSVFARQAIMMVWDYAESNPFCDSSGSYNNMFERQVKGFATIGEGIPGMAIQSDANSQTISTGKLVSTDPPYYDNIGYADLSDFFYVWSRYSLKHVFPDLFSTLAVPKVEELIANPYRHGSKEKAEAFYLGGMTQSMRFLAEHAHPAYPVTIYYALANSDGEARPGYRYRYQRSRLKHRPRLSPPCCRRALCYTSGVRHCTQGRAA
jgi:putative DNA methylase